MDIIYKTSYEQIKLVFDFANDMTMSDEIISTYAVKYVWLTADNLPIDVTGTLESSKTNGNSTVTLNIVSGTAGYKYLISVDMVTNYGNSYKQLILLIIDQKIIKAFNKPADENIYISIDFSNEVLTDTINSKTVTAVDLYDGSSVTSTIIDASAIDGKLINIGVKAGTAGRTYQITTKVDTNTSTKFQKDILLFVNSDFIDTTTTAAKVVFIDSPANTTIGTTLGTSPSYVRVQIQNVSSAGVSTAGVLITMSLASGTGVLNGTKQKTTDSSGYAIFDDLNLSTVGAKTITASCLGLTSATSDSFTIS